MRQKRDNYAISGCGLEPHSYNVHLLQCYWRWRRIQKNTQSGLTHLGLISCNSEQRGMFKRCILLSFDFIMLQCSLKVDYLTGSYQELYRAYFVCHCSDYQKATPDDS